MKVGVDNMLAALKVFGTGKVNYVELVILHLKNGRSILARTVTVVDRHLIHGKSVGQGNRSYMLPVEELAAIEVEWVNLPEGVTDIPSALAHEKKARK